MTVLIRESNLVTLEEGSIWQVLLEIDDGANTWLLPTTAPGEVLEAALLAHFTLQEPELTTVAQQKGYTKDRVYSLVEQQEILMAIVKMTVNELNVLRALHLLPPITYGQARDAILALIGG